MKISATLILFLVALNSFSQEKISNVVTTDVDNFWQAYDSIITTSDSVKQLEFIEKLYINRGTEGLKSFMEVRDYTGEMWVKLINKSPLFWKSIRPNTLIVKEKAQAIQEKIDRLKTIYPQLKDARIYFAIGGLNTGGTTMSNQILIGSEIATGDSRTDLSDLSPNSAKWLSSVFKQQSMDNIVPLNIHEYVHTQQRGIPANLLAHSIKEGSCDFIMELVMGKPIGNNYIVYGRENEAEIKESFKTEMFSDSYNNWLYNGSSAKTMADLGYFMGYTISKSFYNNAKNKKQAVRRIIELNYSDTNAVEKFLAESKYYTEPYDKNALVQAFNAKKVHVLRIEPFNNGEMNADPSVKEITIVFSKPMNKNRVSINKTEGKDYPIKGLTGYSEDGTRLTLKVEMLPEREYEFVITNKSFISEDGYPLIPLDVKFRTGKEK